MKQTGSNVIRQRKKLILLFSLVGCALATPLVIRGFKPQVSLELTNGGLSSLKYDGAELLNFGEFRVLRVIMRDPSGKFKDASVKSTLSVDPSQHQLTRTLDWGSIAAKYSTSGNQVNLTIRTVNRSNSTIQELSFEPLGLRLPARALEYDGSTPLLGHNVGDPTLVSMSWGSGLVVLANEDVVRPLLVGFPWAVDRPANTIFPIRVSTGRDPMLPDMLPYINRAIPPGASDTFRLSLRFGARGTSALKVGNDILQRFANAYPSQIKWKDRRPIGTVFLATSGLKSPTNPRGWLLDPKLDVTTPSGRAKFRERILQTVDATVRVLRSMNAQGVITWDIEGQQYPEATYVGDPRLYKTFAPEMDGLADEYFARLRDSGFRIGVCVRPQQVILDPGKGAYERDSQDPERTLADKIAWAKQRWGATIFYVDDNGQPSHPIKAAIFEKLAQQFPDVLLVPEHKNVQYFAYTAPYFGLHDGIASTPAAVKAVYPGAFSLVNTADGHVDQHHDDLVGAIKQGDILMYRSWYEDPANAEVRSLY